MNALYIGRFQPFHKGHANAVEQIMQTISTDDILYIGIGSAENNFTDQNPLTAGERFEIIESAMQEMGIEKKRYSIVPIRNIDHYALWPYHVQQYLPKITHFFSGSPLVRQLWHTAFPHSQITTIQKTVSVSGTQTRKNIAEELSIDTLCMPSTVKHITQWDIGKRLRTMSTV